MTVARRQVSDRPERDFTAQDEANLVRLASLISAALDALAARSRPKLKLNIVESCFDV